MMMSLAVLLVMMVIRRGERKIRPTIGNVIIYFINITCPSPPTFLTSSHLLQAAYRPRYMQIQLVEN